MSEWIQKSKYGFSGSKRAHFLWFRVLQCNICKILAFLGQIIILYTILVNWGSIWAKFNFLSFWFFLLKYYPFSKSDASILKRLIFMAYFSFLGAWIQKLRNSPCLLLLAYFFGYKLFERLKFDIMNTKKSYVASLCLYFKRSTLNPTSSNITHFRKFKVSWPFQRY